MTGATVVDTEAAAGGGSVPGRTIPSAGVAIAVVDVDTALRMLRDGACGRARTRRRGGVRPAHGRPVDDERLALAALVQTIT